MRFEGDSKMTASNIGHSRGGLVQNVAFAFLGCTIALFGCGVILDLYAHAEMIDPAVVVCFA